MLRSLADPDASEEEFGQVAMSIDSPVEICSEHTCCIHAPRVETTNHASHLAGEWHLRWMPDDSAWFLVPPKGNVWEIRVTDGADPVEALAVEGVVFDGIRDTIARQGLFPPC
jgi:hypothetical protein